MARHAPPDLRRRGPSRDPKRRFILYCEGRNTEPDYFKALQRTCDKTIILIDPIPAAGVPLTIAQKAVERAKELGLAKRSRKPSDSFAEKDQVWAVFDRDEHPNYAEAVNLCEQSGVGVARSNPCFELWLILHVQDFDRPDDRHAVQRHAQTLWPDYAPDRGKTMDFSCLIPAIDQAERRAEVLLARREKEGDPHGPPSTTVGRLTRAIREAIQANTPRGR